MKKAIAGMSVLAAQSALAASGTSLNTNFETILSTLQSVGVTIATIAFLWAGFKIFFLGAQIREVAGPVIGAVIVGSAAWIANLLVS